MATSSFSTPSKTILKWRAFWRRLFGLTPSVFSEALQACFASAKQLSVYHGSASCAPLHMLLALSTSDRGIAVQLLRSLEFCGDEAARKITERIHADNQAGSQSAKSEFSDGFKIMLALAGRQANRWREYYVGTHHVLFALTQWDDVCSEFLQNYSIDPSTLKGALVKLAEKQELVD